MTIQKGEINMMKKKINTKDWERLPIEKWNTTTYQEFMKSLHIALFTVPYKSFINIAGERAGLNRALREIEGMGFNKKESRQILKDFIYKTFTEHKSNNHYIGVSFTFVWQYKANVYQKMIKDLLSKKEIKLEIEDEEDFYNWI